VVKIIAFEAAASYPEVTSFSVNSVPPVSHIPEVSDERVVKNIAFVETTLFPKVKDFLCISPLNSLYHFLTLDSG